MPNQDEAVPALLVGGRRFDPADGVVVRVGRDQANEVVLDGSRVSRVHVTIEVRNGVWSLADAQSRNGTFLDGQPVAVVVITGPMRFLLGSPDDGTALDVSLAPADARPAAPPAARPTPPAGPAQPTQDVRPAAPARPIPPGGQAAPGVPARPDRPGTGASAAIADGDAKSELGHLESVYRPAAAKFRIGRAADNDLALQDDSRASRYHAELSRSASGQFEVADLGSHNGTFVNGQRISRSPLNDGDIVAVGNHVFRFHNGTLETFTQTDGTSLDVAGVRVVIDNTTILDYVAFSVPARSMLAVVGPSGAGKTTLLRALTGFSQPTMGAIRFGGRDLYADYEELRSRLGYVPQDDLVHEQLTVRTELEYAGALRLPPDLGGKGISARATEVMEELGLSARANLPIERLSGGQRKRVSVGVELLTQPALLYLDEPTSGLDPGNERNVMQVLRRLADGGRIVVVVTHSTQSLDVADRALFLAKGGHMAYFGPPSAAEGFFASHGITGGWPAIFQALEGDNGAEWAHLFRQSSDFEAYVGDIGRSTPGPRPVPSAAAARQAGVKVSRSRATVSPRRQSFILCRRQLRLIAGDRKALLLLCAQAPLFGLILTVLFPPGTMSTSRGPFAALLEWLAIVSTTWLGASNTIREIVKEQSIYRRERAAGLSLMAYTGSKIIVFGAITIIQSFVLLLFLLARQSLPPSDPTKIIADLGKSGLLKGLRPFADGSISGSQALELFIAMALAGLAGMAIGLVVSSAVRRSDQAVFMLPVILVVQMALSQPMLQLQSPSKAVTYLGYLTSADWGVNAVGSSTSLNQLMTSYQLSLNSGQDQLKQDLGYKVPQSVMHTQFLSSIHGNSVWAHKPGTYLLSIFVLLFMILVLLTLCCILMRRLDTGTPKSLVEELRGAASRLSGPGGRAPAPGRVGGPGPGMVPPTGQQPWLNRFQPRVRAELRGALTPSSRQRPSVLRHPPPIWVGG